MPLKKFYAIIPAVSISFVDHVVAGREKLKKINNQSAFISDDGFALGVAFFLRILNVSEEFDTLNWFDSIEMKLNKDREEAELRRGGRHRGTTTASGFEDDNFEEELSLKRLESQRNEYHQLKYAITACNILFKEI